MQYFEGVACPSEVRIPLEDVDAYEWYPAHRWIYNKLVVAQSQGLACAPHGVCPPEFPVFSKPITNLRGMGVGSRVLPDIEHYWRHLAPGHFWMTLLQGEHVSSDIAIVRGSAKSYRHSRGMPAGEGTFDHWVIESVQRPELEAYLDDWISRHLGSYTGMLNVETIGSRIIDAHLRFADQWPDLYGKDWLEAVVKLYSRGEWTHADHERRKGFSVALFGPHGRRYRHPPAELVERVRRMPQVTSVQITFHEDRPPESQPMPPGGFRLAIVNCGDLECGRRARAVLAQHFSRSAAAEPLLAAAY